MNSPARYDLPTAVGAIRAAQDSRQTLTILKAIAGKAAAGDLLVYAEQFRERVTPIDQGPCGQASLDHDELDPIPADFWRASSAATLLKDARWQSNSLSLDWQCLALELPYRLRGHTYSDQRVRLWQSAFAFTFDADGIWALAAERDWKPWTEHFERAGRRGADRVWKRDEVLLMFAAGAAADPSLVLDRDKGRIVSQLQDLSLMIDPNAQPDLSDLYKMASRICGLTIDSNEEIPPSD